MRLLFDIGGSNTRLALGEQNGSIGEPVIFETPRLFKLGIEKIMEEAIRLAGGRNFSGAAGGLAGPLSSDKRMVIASPALPDWAGKPFCEILEKNIHAPVYLENDTALVGLGEIHDDRWARNTPIVTYMTVSTGIGACRYVDGRIDRTARGFEVGHHIIDIMSGETLEQRASGSGVKKRYGVEPKDTSDPEIWREIRRGVTVGIHNMILFWSPDAVIVGGGIATDPRFDFPACVHEVKNIMKIFPDIPPILPAELGSLGGLHGAHALLKQKEESQV